MPSHIYRSSFFLPACRKNVCVCVLMCSKSRFTQRTNGNPAPTLAQVRGGCGLPPGKHSFLLCNSPLWQRFYATPQKAARQKECLSRIVLAPSALPAVLELMTCLAPRAPSLGVSGSGSRQGSQVDIYINRTWHYSVLHTRLFSEYAGYLQHDPSTILFFVTDLQVVLCTSGREPWILQDSN